MLGYSKGGSVLLIHISRYYVAFEVKGKLKLSRSRSLKKI